MTKIISLDGLSLAVDPRTGRARTVSEASGSARRLASCPPYRSKWELTFADYLRGLLAAQQITWWSYEPVTLKLARGLRYTPDFLAQHVTRNPVQDPRLIFYEVKGWSKNRREGMAKLKMAPQVCPWASFVLVEYRKGTMMLTPLTP
ncbi:MAG: hypothetical protein KGI71_05320 [Patescibacteria group bacterium]|nr:hypothetical protein [Patescibacteria group bacterium]